MLALLAIFWLVANELSPRLTIALVALAVGLLVSVTLARRRRLARLTRTLALALVSLVTVALAASVVLIVAQLVYGTLMIEWLGRQPSPAELLRNAALIWLSNLLLFAVWYWELDGGGPAGRHSGSYRSVDLVFPQQQRDATGDGWVPDFFDYLFLAFNTSTAFSPTDTLMLSRRMKALLMCQSLISLAVLAVVVARAVNSLA